MSTYTARHGDMVLTAYACPCPDNTPNCIACAVRGSMESQYGVDDSDLVHREVRLSKLCGSDTIQDLAKWLTAMHGMQLYLLDKIDDHWGAKEVFYHPKLLWVAHMGSIDSGNPSQFLSMRENKDLAFMTEKHMPVNSDYKFEIMINGVGVRLVDDLMADPKLFVIKDYADNGQVLVAEYRLQDIETHVDIKRPFVDTISEMVKIKEKGLKRHANDDLERAGVRMRTVLYKSLEPVQWHTMPVGKVYNSGGITFRISKTVWDCEIETI